jgi:hypothetical protein
MMIAIDTQYRENYGAHDWDGEGECPQYWKSKGGSTYKILGVPLNIDYQAVVDMVRDDIEHRSEYSEQYIVGWSVESDDFLSWFELSQMKYEGEIVAPEPTIEYVDLTESFA